MKHLHRIAITLVTFLFASGLVLAAPAQADIGVTPLPDACPVGASEYTLLTQTLAQTRTSVEQYKTYTASLVTQLEVQTRRAESYKAQVARLKAKLAAARS